MKKSNRSALMAVACVAFIGGAAVLSLRGHQADDDDKPQRPPSANGRTGKTAAGVKLDRETQKRIGIELRALQPISERPQITVYGALEQDPSEEFVLRSPLPGFVVGEGNWPILGGNVREGAVVGAVRPRLTAVDQLTLRERLATMRTEEQAAEASVDAHREELARLRQLNADDKDASDKAVQEASAQLAAEQAKLQAAQASVQLIADALQPESKSGATPLAMSKGGQVLEVSAQPGESVESGQVLIRVASFNHLLARLYVPPGQVVDDTVTRGMIAPAGHEDDAIPGHRVALAAAIDPKYQGQILIFRISPGKRTLRPGQAVTARLAIPGPEEHGLFIPSRAIVRFQGQTWVYIKTEPERFVRRAVTPEHAAGGGWVARSGFQPNQQVVVSGAQLLLSEEMKSQLQPDED